MERIDRIDRISADVLRKKLNFCGLPHPRFSVVIPIVMDPDGTKLLIEVRAPGISQAGDPCFPGGKIEEAETPHAAAVRELGEELGIVVSESELLGRIPTVDTYLGSMTDIFVCMLSPEKADAMSPNIGEVSEVLRVPISYFAERAGDMSFQFAGHTIWGMTAGAIRHLCEIIGDDPR